MLITSISVKGSLNKDTTEILIITSPTFQQIIERELSNLDMPINYHILNANSLFEGACARLAVFDYENIYNYDKILYLDVDILINSDINILFDLEITSEDLYALQEGNIGDPLWGSQFFDFSKYDSTQSAFTSGILLFRRSTAIVTLFEIIRLHIDEYVKAEMPLPSSLDQPFIVYNAITQNRYNNQLLKLYAENEPKMVNPNKIIYHFPGGTGDYICKYDRMQPFWLKMNDT